MSAFIDDDQQCDGDDDNRRPPRVVASRGSRRARRTARTRAATSPCAQATLAEFSQAFRKFTQKVHKEAQVQ